MTCNPNCIACSHKHLTMEESLRQKHTYLCNKLAEWKELIEPVISVSAEHRTGYRDKVSLALQFNDSQWQAGMMRRDVLIPTHNCPVQTTRVNNVLRLVLSILPSYNEFPAVRYVQAGKQLTLVVKSRALPSTDWISEEFKKAFFDAGMNGLWLHLFPSSGKKVFGKGGWHHILGIPQSIQEGEDKFYYGPAAFQQLLPELSNEALDEALTFLNPGPDSAVVDLYSGTGSSLKRWISAGAKAIGVEQFPGAVSFAAMNVPDATILLGSCTQRIPHLTQWIEQNQQIAMTNHHKELVKLLYANPPRTGIEPEVLDWIVNYRPVRLAYLSCNALSLRNNLHYLSAHGYVVRRIIPFDFFPQTRHVETLTFLS